MDNPSPANSKLDQFRARTKRLQIHSLELALLWVVGLHLVFLPWAIGTMRLWSQWISFGFSALSLIIALWPRSYTPEHTGTNSFRLIPWPKLIRFPIFWLGLALLGLIAIQALNPAWSFRTDGRLQWAVRVSYITWLPTSVQIPISYWGPWRNLMIYSSAWMTVCSIWVGFTRRRTIQRLLLVLVLTGLSLAGLGFIQRLIGNGKMYWVLDVHNDTYFSTFVYKNHAGCYLFITLTIACGFAAWHYFRGMRRFEKSNPSGVFAFFATCMACSVFISFARGASLGLIVYIAVIAIAFAIYSTRSKSGHPNRLILLSLITVFCIFLKIGLEVRSSHLAWDHLRQVITGKDLSFIRRNLANQASVAMLKHYWILGAGSGSFKYLFPSYQQHVPEIAKNMFWEHAHNDILEIPIELGLPGVLIIAASFVFWGLTLIRNYVWQNPLSASVLLGAVFLIGMSWGDFVFQNPAILITWCALWPACTLWTQLEEQRARP